jgi:hypothetical protein
MLNAASWIRGRCLISAGHGPTTSSSHGNQRATAELLVEE